MTLKVSQHSWRELREQPRGIPEVHHIAFVHHLRRMKASVYQRH
jgi:hypothetical protein